MRCHAMTAPAPSYLRRVRVVTHTQRQTWSTDPCRRGPREPAKTSSCALRRWAPGQSCARRTRLSAVGGVKVMRDAYMQADEGNVMGSRVACKLSAMRPRSKKANLRKSSKGTDPAHRNRQLPQQRCVLPPRLTKSCSLAHGTLTHWGSISTSLEPQGTCRAHTGRQMAPERAASSEACSYGYYSVARVVATRSLE